MKTIIAGIGVVLMYLTGLLMILLGLLMMNTLWGIAGVIIGVCVFPIPFLLAFAVVFASWASFFGWAIWFALIAMMIYIGKDE